MIIKPSKKNSGFTLIEVMISLMVLLTLTFIFAACVPMAKKTSKVNGQYSQALSLCQHKLDQMRAYGYGKITYSEMSPLLIDSGKPGLPWTFTQVDSVQEILIDPQTSINVVDPGNDKELKVTVTISWKNTAYEGKRSEASLSAIIANVE